jgi:hypothetical protein
MDLAGNETATRTGATCFVGSGDGMGARRTGRAPCVERAGVDALDLETEARRAGFDRAWLRLPVRGCFACFARFAGLPDFGLDR